MKIERKHALTSLIATAIIAVAAVAMWGQTSGNILVHGKEGTKDLSPKIALAYVVESGNRTIDPDIFTHLIYAFAEFNDECNGIVIKRPEKLQEMIDFKKQNPELKVILGIGGDKKEGFSEMARDKKKRKSFIKNVKHSIDSMKLDGIDLDWEFPTTTNGGHTATKEDDKNYVTLVKDLRKALGKNKWISYYSHNTALYIDHKGMAPYVSYVNVSGYNLSIPKEGKQAYHQSPLYSSKKCGDWSISKAIEKHIQLGVPKEKVLMGIPFYCRGKSPFPTYMECRFFDKYAKDLTIEWDDDAQAPYYADHEGNLIAGFDDERSIGAKFDFIRANGLSGVFVWHYDGDYYDQRLGKAISEQRK